VRVAAARRASYHGLHDGELKKEHVQFAKERFTCGGETHAVTFILFANGGATA